MARLNGARKGKEAEREVAGLIQEWWRALEPSATFVRTPQSGGWASTPIRAEFRACADLMTDAALFPFAPEVKRNENWEMSNVLAGRASPVWAWWAQASEAALKQGGQPLLIMRKSREQWCALSRIDYVDSIMARASKHVSSLSEFRDTCVRVQGPNREAVYVFYLQSLLDTSPETWRRA